MRRSLSRWSTEHLETSFALLSALLLFLVGIALYVAIERTLTRQSLQTVAAEASADNSRLSPLFLSIPWDGPLTPGTTATIDRAIETEGAGRYLLVKLWTRAGEVLYSSHHEIIGTSNALEENPELRAALRGAIGAKLDESEEENNDTLGLGHLLEVYTPLRNSEEEIIGAFEVYRDGEPLFQQIRSLRSVLGGGLAIGLILVWAGLFGLVHQAGQAVRQERRALLQLEEDLATTLRGALSALSEAVEAKDAYTAGHVGRVSSYAVAIAEALGVPSDQRLRIEYAAILHDVGKLSIPDAILLKPGPLGPDERDKIETHAAKGEHILRKVPGLEKVAAMVRHHHEHWDGSGYPDGLRGEAIPLGSRIIAVADAYDAMATDRPYRRAMHREEVLEELEKGRGIQFDPVVVSVFLRLFHGTRRRASAALLYERVPG